MNAALVLGVNGQDGSFLAELLTLRGYRVLGVDIQDSTSLLPGDPNFTYEKLDLCNTAALNTLLRRYQPEVVFHVAAVHGSAGTMYETIWQDMLLVNMGSVQVVLEYLRLDAPQAAFIYANSAKVFGPVYPQQITENSPKRSSCLYTVTKMGASDLISYYRDRYKIRGSNIFLFNHESERRPPGFFISKLTAILAAALRDPSYQGSVYTLDFECDWGSAEEYMDIAIDIAEKAAGEDFVLGSGIAWKAREFAEKLFLKRGLNYRNHVLEENRKPAAESLRISYQVTVDKLEEAISRRPKRSILEVCDDILYHKYGIDKTIGKI